MGIHAPYGWKDKQRAGKANHCREKPNRMKAKILVIDDSQSLTWLLERLLSKEHEAIRKNNGMEAMFWLSDGNMPDLIITDLNMPFLSGTELVANLKKSGLYCDIPIIILSGSEDVEAMEQCRRFGAVDFLEKPFNPTQFMVSVEKALQTKAALAGNLAG
jgi:two-component system, chemotaxis family, chemotaxis protein CheY